MKKLVKAMAEDARSDTLFTTPSGWMLLTALGIAAILGFIALSQEEVATHRWKLEVRNMQGKLLHESEAQEPYVLVKSDNVRLKQHAHKPKFELRKGLQVTWEYQGEIPQSSP